MKENYKYILLSLGAAGLILWRMLLPGYILTLDLVWTPLRPLVWDGNGFNNAFLVMAFFHFLAQIIPSWAAEKVMLLVLFFSLFYLPLRFLPGIKTKNGRIFAALLYGLNPFVYSRMLAGQWLALFGYALLPIFFAALIKFLQNPRRKSGFWLGLALALVGLFSIHFLYLALVIFGGAVVANLVINRKDSFKLKKRADAAVIALGVFALLSFYWIAPALTRPAPLETRFDRANFAAFAAAGNDEVPVMLNVMGLGGYWGEATAWKFYFLWPQSSLFFWRAFAAIALLIILGAGVSFKDPKLRWAGASLLLIGITAYVAALGAADTPFKDFNLFLYGHVPFWNGLRDSQKISGLLGFAYAVFAGIGVDRLARTLARRLVVRRLAMAGLLVLPLIFGMYEWAGFDGQLIPTDYPAEWYQAKAIIDAAPAGEKVLVLPWHGYLSLDFDHQLVAANPAADFFGPARVVVSKSIEAGNVRDTEIDPDYRALDTVFGASQVPASADLREALRHGHIGYVLVIKNALASTAGNWTDDPDVAARFAAFKTGTSLDGHIDFFQVVVLR